MGKHDVGFVRVVLCGVVVGPIFSLGIFFPAGRPLVFVLAFSEGGRLF